MLMTPLPWDMTSWRMKRKFGKLWYWLKQKQDIRLAMVGIKPEFDTLMIATEVLQRVDQYTLNSLVTDINKGLPVDIVKSLPLGDDDLLPSDIFKVRRLQSIDAIDDE